MTNYLKIEWDGFKHKMKNKQYRKKTVFQVIDSTLVALLIFGWMFYGFIPIDHALATYEKSKNYDTTIGVCVALFMIASIYLVLGPVSRIISFPLAWAFGYTKSRDRPVLPKGWKAPKK